MNSRYPKIEVSLDSDERVLLASFLRKSLASASAQGLTPDEIKKAQELQAHVEGRATTTAIS